MFCREVFQNLFPVLFKDTDEQYELEKTLKLVSKDFYRAITAWILDQKNSHIYFREQKSKKIVKERKEIEEDICKISFFSESDSASKISLLALKTIQLDTSKKELEKEIEQVAKISHIHELPDFN